MSQLEWQDDDGASFEVAAEPIDLSIPLRFGGVQPSLFGAPPATAEPLRGDGFVGDTRAGGSCNCETVRLTPHCNGTHTECVAHVADPSAAGVVKPPVGTLATGWGPAALLTVEPVEVAASEDLGVPDNCVLEDRVISRLALARAWRAAGPDLRRARGGALVVRTAPNPPQKRWWRHDSAGLLPPFFSTQAIAWIVERRFEHLLVDTPSLDRLDDGGRLASHRAFWGLPPGSRERTAARRPTATVTELIYVPDEVRDGLYLLCLNLPPFVSDAAPSRPLLYPLVQRSHHPHPEPAR